MRSSSLLAVGLAWRVSGFGQRSGAPLDFFVADPSSIGRDLFAFGGAFSESAGDIFERHEPLPHDLVHVQR